jgi:hypothetical protein
MPWKTAGHSRQQARALTATECYTVLDGRAMVVGFRCSPRREAQRITQTISAVKSIDVRTQREPKLGGTNEDL